MKLIIIISLILILSCNGASAWYDGFDYRIPITIDNTGNPALEHYQFNVSFSEGINESSIRVVNENSYSTVPHWCENETDGLCYELWFNVSVESEVNTDYYIYYGNDSISSASDYDSTFTKKYNDSGLVLELHMDEGSGNSVTVDSSGEGNHGTLTYMNTTGNTTSGWQGTDGGQWNNRSDTVFSTGDHLRIDGRNDYVNCGNDTSLDFIDAITLCMWLKTSDEGNFMWTAAKGEDFNTELYGIRKTNNDKLQFRIYDAQDDGGYVYSDSVINNGYWHHIVGVANISDSGTLYVDGILQSGSISMTNVNSFSTGNNFLLGRHPQPTINEQWFNGSIDEVRIYNRTLSEDEIYRQYIRSKYAANTPLISIGYAEKIPHPFILGAYLFYGEMSAGLTGFRDGMGRYLIWGVVFFAVSLAFALITKIKQTLIGGK